MQANISKLFYSCTDTWCMFTRTSTSSFFRRVPLSPTNMSSTSTRSNLWRLTLSWPWLRYDRESRNSNLWSQKRRPPPNRTRSIPSYKPWSYTHPVTPVNIIFVTWKQICVSYVFFHAEFKYGIRTALSPTVLVWQNFLKCSFSKFSFSVLLPVHFKYGWGSVYILSIVWVWKLNQNKESRHVSVITDSQTVQAQDMYWHAGTWN